MGDCEQSRVYLLQDERKTPSTKLAIIHVLIHVESSHIQQAQAEQ